MKFQRGDIVLFDEYNKFINLVINYRDDLYQLMELCSVSSYGGGYTEDSLTLITDIFRGEI